MATEDGKVQGQLAADDSLTVTLGDAESLEGALSPAQGLAAELTADEGRVSGSLSDESSLGAVLQAEENLNGVINDSPTGVTDDYNLLRNKPTLNGIPLQGEMTETQKELLRGPKGDPGNP
ncbi:hypothetical protein, partial [Faecalibaculum rodentium]